MKILDGKAVSKHLRDQFKAEVDQLSHKFGVKPGLAVVLVGNDPASEVYVSSKIKACEEIGMASFEHRVPEDISKSELHQLVQTLNQDPKVDGILVQLPLPKHLNENEVLSWISPSKDADCLTTENMGLLWAGRALTTPCTPSGVMEILNYYDIPLAGVNAAVVGRSAIVGKPMAHLLTEANATVTVCHSKTKDLKSILKNCDLVVVAAGKPEFLGKEYFKTGVVVVDVGIHRNPPGSKKRLCGDVKFDEVSEVASYMTPVPGGVGPMTITMLIKNTITLFKTHY